MSVFFGVARSCGIKTIIGVSSGAAVLTLISSVIYKWDLVIAAFYYIRNIATLGGTFWGGVSVALAAMTVFIWALCVCVHLGEKSKKELGDDARWFKYLILAMVVCFLTWLMAFCGVVAVFQGMEDWNAFHGAAYFIMHVPLILIVIGVLVIAASITG
jgi:hypothetical protein